MVIHYGLTFTADPQSVLQWEALFNLFTQSCRDPCCVVFHNHTPLRKRLKSCPLKGCSFKTCCMQCVLIRKSSIRFSTISFHQNNQKVLLIMSAPQYTLTGEFGLDALSLYIQKNAFHQWQKYFIRQILLPMDFFHYFLFSGGLIQKAIFVNDICW